MDLEERFLTLTGADIETFVADSQEEHLHLEFKTTPEPAFKKPDEKQKLSKAVSALANSDGGLIVWGVFAKRIDQDGLDCAKEVRPIQDIESFVARLSALEGDVTSPIIDGIKSRGIALPAGGHAAVTLVPRSDGGPYQAKLGENRYYKRSGDRSLQMEHFEIEDMFGRRKRPILEIITRATRSGSGGEGKGAYRNVRFHVEIRNAGRGAARDIYLALEPPEGIQIVAPAGQNVGFREIRPAFQEGERHFTSASDFVLHPGLTWSVALFDVKVLSNQPIPRIFPRFRLAAEGFRLLEGNVSVDFEEVGLVLGRTP
jgi:hypothetical protein